MGTSVLTILAAAMITARRIEPLRASVGSAVPTLYPRTTFGFFHVRYAHDLHMLFEKGKAAHRWIPYLIRIRGAEPSHYTRSHHLPFQGRSLLVTFPALPRDQPWELPPRRGVLVGEVGFEPTCCWFQTSRDKPNSSTLRWWTRRDSHPSPQTFPLRALRMRRN